MSNFFRCFLGPRLYRLYKLENRQGKDYKGNPLEHYSDGIIRAAMFSLSMAWSLGIYTSPFLASMMYRRGYFTHDGALSLIRLSSTLGAVLFLTLFLRSIGRLINVDYLTFIAVLDSYKEIKTRQYKLQMATYDFDFREWPADFYWNETSLERQRSRHYLPKRSSNGTLTEKILRFPLDFISTLAMHSFGRMMIYPGSVGILNKFLFPILLKGRSKLVEENLGERYKLVAEDGNEIDSMFIDRRNDSNYENGNTLVVCCEGNAGFYEYGITGTPIGAGYSVLGWNHPGFSSSTGVPFPEHELNAVDVVMQFAIYKLGFRTENIVIYAWSIGGFAATWAAMNYPDIKGLVLDASFDDLVPLAIPKMPASWKSLVVTAIRDHMNLNNAEQLCQYNGPVLLIRRSKDEIISTVPSRSIQTNRGNDLLTVLLRTRYPNLVNDETIWALQDWLAGDKRHQTVLWTQQGVDEGLCDTHLMSYIEENGESFPLQIGEGMQLELKIQMVLYLADKHMVDYDSTHCIPLPPRFFHLPWGISAVSNFSGQKAHI